MNLEYQTTEDGIAFTYVNGVKGTLNYTDVSVLSMYYNKLPFSSRYLEIGSYLGCSSVIAGLSLKNKSLVFSHDLWENDMTNLTKEGGPPPLVDNYFYKFYENIRNNNLEGIVIPIRGDGSYTVGIHSDKSIDLAFVDGDHSYYGCFKDLNAVFPKMKPKSTILCHDATPGSEVIKSIQEFCKNNNLSEVRGYENSSIVSIHINES
jgi:predicted O-methyltransferase YrrM